MAKDTKDNTTITSIDDTPVVVTEKAPVVVDVTDNGDNFAGKRVTVTIHQGEGELGRQAVFLGLNGHGFNIPRGVPVDLPVEALEILENAVQTVYENTGGKTTEREVKRFSYTAKYPR